MPSLPIIKPTKFSDRDVVRFFDTFRDAPLEYSANEVDAVVSFFEKSCECVHSVRHTARPNRSRIKQNCG